jgi:hypothetical protein
MQLLLGKLKTETELNSLLFANTQNLHFKVFKKFEIKF